MMVVMKVLNWADMKAEEMAASKVG